MKKAIAILLFTAILIGTMSSCAGSLQKEYMLKGDFYNMLLSEMNYYPIDSSWDEMNESDNYNIEAKTMVDWGLLSSEEAFKGLEKPVTKEVALVALLNTMYFSKQGNIDNIKDAKMSSYPQEMADSVASGITELDSNNCINAKQKLTYEECAELIDNTSNAEANGHFDEGGSAYLNFGEDAIVFNENDIPENGFFEVHGFEEAYEAVNNSDSSPTSSLVDSFVPPIVSFADYKKADNNAFLTETEISNDLFSVTLNMVVYNAITKEMGKAPDQLTGREFVYGVYDVDSYAKLYESYNQSQEVASKKEIKPFAGIIQQIEGGNSVSLFSSLDESEIFYTIILKPMTDLEISQFIETKNSKGSAVGSVLSSFIPESVGYAFEKIPNGIKLNVDGYDVQVDLSNGLDVTAKKDFVHGGDGYKKGKVTTHFEANAYLKNFHIDMDNVKNFFKKKYDSNKSPVFKLTYDRGFSFDYNTDNLRLGPDDNRNGKALTNIKNALKKGLTDDSNSGARTIRLAKFSCSFYKIFTLEIYLLLNINIDGSITIEFSQTGSGIEVSRKNDLITIKPLGKKELETELKTNFRIGLEAEPALYCVLPHNRPLVVASFELYAKGSASFNTYLKNDIEDSSVRGVDATMLENIAGFKEYSCCVDIHADLYYRIALKDKRAMDPRKDSVLCQFVGKYLKDKKIMITDSDWQAALDKDNDKHKICKICSFHWEADNDNLKLHIVSQCTRGKTENEQDSKKDSELDKEAKRQGKFLLEKTKVTMSTNSLTRIKIEGNPLSDKDEKNEKAICVRALNDQSNKNLVFAHYEPTTRSILISSKGEAGSAEYCVYVSQNEKSGKVCSFEYYQTFSVTVDNPREAADAYNSGGGGYSAAGGGTNSFGGGTMGSR